MTTKTVSQRIDEERWLYAPQMDRGGASLYGWYGGPQNVEGGTRQEVAASIGATEAEVEHEEHRLDREAERCYDASRPALPVR